MDSAICRVHRCCLTQRERYGRTRDVSVSIYEDRSFHLWIENPLRQPLGNPLIGLVGQEVIGLRKKILHRDLLMRYPFHDRLGIHDQPLRELEIRLDVFLPKPAAK